jgi:hypothetical protein
MTPFDHPLDSFKAGRIPPKSKLKSEVDFKLLLKGRL